MGFWGSLWNGVKSFARGCVNVVKAVAAPVAKVVTKVVETVKAVATPIVKAVTKIVDFVSKPLQKVASFVSEKLNKAKDWFLEQTSLGRTLYKGYRYIMDETLIGKGIKWVGQKVSQAKEWYDNTPLGRFTNTIMPIVNLAGFAFGGVPGLLLKGFNAVSSIANTIQNPLSLLPSIPGYNRAKEIFVNNRLTQFVGDKFRQLKTTVNGISDKAKDYIQNNKTVQFISSNYQKVKKIKEKIVDQGKDIFAKGSHFFNHNKEKICRYFQNNVLENKYVKSGLQKWGFLKNAALKYGITYSPHAYSYGKGLFKYIKKIFTHLKLQASRIYQNRIKKTPYGRKIAKGLNFINSYAYKPTKFFASSTYNKIIRPSASYIWDKVQESKIYEKYLKYPIQSFRYIQKQAKHIQAKKIIANSQFGQRLKNQNRGNGMDSSNFLGSYLNKYGGQFKSIQKIQKNFVNVNDYSRAQSMVVSEFKQPKQKSNFNIEREKTQTLNSLVDSGKVKIQSLIFNTKGCSNSSFTIEGKLWIENKTNDRINFQIIAGQVFGCSKAKTSQHTVARGQKGFIEPLKRKEVRIESFCGDSSLKWPYGDSNYTMTNYILKDFKDDINQDAVWNLTR